MLYLFGIWSTSLSSHTSMSKVFFSLGGKRARAIQFFTTLTDIDVAAWRADGFSSLILDGWLAEIGTFDPFLL